jgi:hypothetical protein
MEKLISKRASFEPAVAPRETNVAYCSKEENVIIQFQGIKTLSRAELHYQQLLIATKEKSRVEIATEFPRDFVLHHSTVEKLIASNMKTKGPWGGSLKRKNVWIAGKAGTGKSRWASGIVAAEEQYRKTGNKWWDGYCSELHRAVIVEDMGPETMKYLVNLIKVWADRYSFIGEVKNGSISIWPGNFYLIVTSNYPIDMCVWNEADREAVKRRFTEWWIESPQDIAMVRRPNVLDQPESDSAGNGEQPE